MQRNGAKAYKVEKWYNFKIEVLIHYTIYRNHIGSTPSYDEYLSHFFCSPHVNDATSC